MDVCALLAEVAQRAREHGKGHTRWRLPSHPRVTVNVFSKTLIGFESPGTNKNLADAVRPREGGGQFFFHGCRVRSRGGCRKAKLRNVRFHNFVNSRCMHWCKGRELDDRSFGESRKRGTCDKRVHGNSMKFYLYRFRVVTRLNSKLNRFRS